MSFLKRLFGFGNRAEAQNDKPRGTPVSETDDGKLFAIIASGKCPDCNRESRFMEGPSGGMSTNIMCEHGKHWFNITPVIGIAQRIKR